MFVEVFRLDTKVPNSTKSSTVNEYVPLIYRRDYQLADM
jgi:hypothetical protein